MAALSKAAVKRVCRGFRMARLSSGWVDYHCGLFLGRLWLEYRNEAMGGTRWGSEQFGKRVMTVAMLLVCCAGSRRQQQKITLLKGYGENDAPHDFVVDWLLSLRLAKNFSL